MENVGGAKLSPWATWIVICYSLKCTAVLPTLIIDDQHKEKKTLQQYLESTHWNCLNIKKPSIVYKELDNWPLITVGNTDVPSKGHLVC